MDREKKLLAAICNGPQYLRRAGILDTRRFTTSNTEEKVRALGVDDPFPWQNYLNERDVVSDHVKTAQAFVDFYIQRL